MIAVLYEGGNLRHKLQAHQLESYDAFRTWNVERQSREYIRRMADTGALYDNMWIDEWGRRGGKTSKWIITAEEEMLRRKGCRGMIATPLQKSIGGIIVPLTKILFADAPPEYFPKYVGSKDADHQGLYVEATDSFCKLVGLDKHPDATRGQFLDFCIVTEAAFVKGLYELVTAVLMPQFRYRPWAWFAGESSTAKAPDCDFNREFREDAKLRGTYRKLTIRDNKQLSDDEIAQEERRSGGKTSPNCRRELYCEEVRDVDEMVVPEFDESVHVVNLWPQPKHALAWEGFDPAITDPCGLVGGFLDWERQCFVVQFAWQRPNASTDEVVAVAQSFEREFWHAQHARPGEKGPKLTIADAMQTGDGRVWTVPEEGLTYWDQTAWGFKANPYGRISDIANRFILDMNVDHAMNVRPAEKGPGSADADLQHIRTLFSSRPQRIVILKNGKTDILIQQLRSGMWNTDDQGHRTDWQRSKTLGHLDCLAALKYLVRDLKWQRNPHPPAVIDPANVQNRWVPEEMRERARRGTSGTLPTFGDRDNSGYASSLTRR